MKKTTFAFAAFAAPGLVLTAGTAAARSPGLAAPDTICTVLGTADRYVGTTVTVRGVAFVDGKATILSDAQCKGALDLSINESAPVKRDVSSFRRTVSGKGVRADATISGRFRATGDAQRPYGIDVYSVRDVNELVVAEGS